MIEENPAAGEPAGADDSGQSAEAQPPETPAALAGESACPTLAAEDSACQPYPPQRGFIAEWAVTIVLLLFVTTNLVQAFVIPTGSMEDTLLVGDHLLVDKLAYSPARGIEKTLMPYQDVRRGDIIVFRYPMEIQQTFVKRCIGTVSTPYCFRICCPYMRSFSSLSLRTEPPTTGLPVLRSSSAQLPPP